ncbi:hypothetical protein [Sphingopyxis granuli]|uniref:hypothetical protein n=1 Tax=Sphingopyxis granuli TaxID=267128 RepID=UPI001BAF3FCB|nr:hypothetical protein [Sphingopyxis granuli]QUM71695.1 hypothetical protein ICN83_15390 [Sphingopyxis granuli]
MNKFSLLASALAVIGAQISVPAYAQHFAVAGTTTTATGTATVNGVACGLNLTVTLGPDLGLGAPHINHTDTATFSGQNTGPFPCPVFSVDGTIDSSGVLTDLTIYQAGSPICSVTGASLPITLANVGSDVHASLGTTTVGACVVDAEMDVFGVQLVP